MKKLFYILSAAVLLFSMAFMTACGGNEVTDQPTLEELKRNAIEKIETYMEWKLQEHDYTEESEKALRSVVVGGRKQIRTCEKQDSLEESLLGMLYNLDAVPYIEEFGEELSGTFILLKEAYQSGLVTTADLERMAYYNNSQIAYPLALNTRVEQAIKLDTATQFGEWKNPEEYADEYEVLDFCGVYHGYYAVKMYSKDYMTSDTAFGEWYGYGEVHFYYVYRYNSIWLWKPNN